MSCFLINAFCILVVSKVNLAIMQY